ncbi:hypothetical protein BJ741DRAFT_653648 [Chytriomyces cf. hyalinus JEL632]|nr:hypothetical protein BJ741DRAFT_653648 [Chytriomyces cf. hyalinus JEL632]
MSSKRLVCSAHRLVLTATPRQVTLRVTFPTDAPAATAKTTLDSFKLSFVCTPASKSSFLEDLDKPTPTEPFFAQFMREKDGATTKEEAKSTVPESGSKQHVPSNLTPGLSLKNINTFSNQQVKLTSTPETTVDGDDTKADIEADEDEDNQWDDDGNYFDEGEGTYDLQDLEYDMEEMSTYKPYQGYSPREVLEDLNPIILETFPHLNKAINEWYEVVGVPKVYLDPSKGSLGILEFRVPGNLARSFARHVGTRYLEWRSEE